MKFKQVNTSVTHSLELLSNMIRGLNVSDIEQLQLNAMSDGTRGLVQFKDMAYSIEVRPLFTKVDDTPEKPTLQHVFFNDVDTTHEPECASCQHYEYDEGDSGINSNCCCPPSYYCACDDETECSAASRRLEDFMDDYNCEHELGDYKPIFGDTGIDKLTIRKDDE